jgi:hypothetical protein
MIAGPPGVVRGRAGAFPFARHARIVLLTVFAGFTVNRGLVRQIARSASSFRFANTCNPVSAAASGGRDNFKKIV